MPPSHRLPFHPGLEGLRGIAVIGVLVFHANPAWLPGGFLGVSTFFTLSGFLITGLLLAEFEERGRIAVGRFWGRRLRRLLPASLVAVLGIAVGAAFFADATQLARLRGDGLAALGYVANWWLIATEADYASLMGSPSPIQHFWSLAIEEQYYAVFPLLCAGLLAVGGRRLLAGVMTLGVVASWAWMAHLAITDVATARIYYGTDTRCGELLAGGLLALFVRWSETHGEAGIRWFDVAGWVGLLVSACFWALAQVEQPLLYRGGFVLYTLSTVAIVAAAVRPDGFVAAGLSLAGLRWVGRISYGAYVYHWPLFLWLDAERVGVDGLALAGVRLAATLACAALSYRFLEEPIRVGRWIRGRERLVVPPLALAAVVIALLVSTPGRFTGELPEPGPGLAMDPGVPPNDGDTRIVVVGDSLGHVIGQGLLAWSKAVPGVAVENLATKGCGVARGAWPEGTGRASLRCDGWPARVSPRLEASPPDLVVVSTAGWDLLPRELPEWGGTRLIGDPDFDAWLDAQYQEALLFFVERGAKVVWLTSPCFQEPGGRQTGVFDPARARHLNESILQPLASRHEPSLRIIDLAGEICPAGRFTNEHAGIADFRPDGIHFSPRGARWVGTWLGGQLLELAADWRGGD